MRLALIFLATLVALAGQDPILIPAIDGEWWTIAGNPDVSPYTTPYQQPVDFGIWQAADSTWQLWSCIRKTPIPGKTRLLHRWEGKRLTDRDWEPKGIAMMGDPGFGETPGGLQAPYVFRHRGLYYMFYGDWENICAATSSDGKTFARRLTPSGKAGMFRESPDANARDAMVLSANRRWYCYYTAHPDRHGSVYARTSKNLRTWSKSKIVATGGSAGTEFNSAECPFVLRHDGYYYLFRTQRYVDPQTSVYRSRDPTDFGIDDDRYLVTRLPVAAPEIFLHEGRHYIAALLPSLAGIRLAKLKWVPKP
ncbi:MAG: family 43 glycosylhydrolase [bacterium]|nr:family 43 glycosylhydrolase [bacterium]